MWQREFFDAIQPHVENGVYINNLGDEGEARVAVASQTTIGLKDRYDPMNFFCLNKNIKSSALPLE